MILVKPGKYHWQEMEESFELLHPSCYIVISLKLALVLVLALFIFPLYFQMLYVLCWVYLALLCVDRAIAVILSAIYLMFLRDLHIFSCSASLFLFYLIFCWLVLSFFFSRAPLSAGSVLHATMLPCHPGSPLHPAPLRIFYLPTSSRRLQLPPPGPLHTLSLSCSSVTSPVPLSLDCTPLPPVCSAFCSDSPVGLT